MRRWLVPVALVHMVAVPAWPALRHDGPIAPISGCAEVVSPGASIQAALRQQPRGRDDLRHCGHVPDPVRASAEERSVDQRDRITAAHPSLCGRVLSRRSRWSCRRDATELAPRRGSRRQHPLGQRLGRPEHRVARRGRGRHLGPRRRSDARLFDVHHNGAFGIRAVGAKDLTIRGNEIASNSTDPNVPAGFAGGVKLNAVDGLTMQRNNVHDNGGGAGIWLDIDSRHFAVTGNRSVNNAGDGIRVEISCNGIIDANTVTGSSEVGIDLFNAHDITLTSNVVHPSARAAFGIRMLSNGRDTSQGDGSCMIAGSFPNSNNRARSNLITLEILSSRVGVEVNGGLSSGNSWRSNTYAVPECSASVWQWWDGTTSQQVGFSGWQSLGQDTNGSCRRAT